MPEKKWVFDTVSLSNFLLSDSTYILKKRYGKHVMITSQVYDEISAGISEFPKLGSVEDLINKKIFNLCVLSAKERPLYIELIGHLGKGEASSIAAAKERSAIVVTDDRTARKQCSQMNILVTGTVGIPGTFTATVMPISATLPITHVWLATGQTPVTHTAGVSSTTSFTWDVTGTQTIAVSAMNIAIVFISFSTNPD